MYCLLQLGKQLDDETLRSSLPQFQAILDKSTNESSTTALRTRLRIKSRLAQLSRDSVDLGPFLGALKHRETSIRWTGAKALLRACPCGGESKTILHLITAIEGELLLDSQGVSEASAGALHGHLLAIGQFLHQRRIGEFEDFNRLISSVLVPCLKFDQLRGSYAIGSFVRDASCYVAWSLSRLSIIQKGSLELLQKSLICLALFDREVGCRRAAAAALQELLGRQPGGPIGVLSILHFSSVSSAEVSFRQNLPEIMEIIPREWSSDLTAHLLNVTLKNFDVKMRELGAEAIAKCNVNISNFHEAYAHSTDDIIHRHGIILALAAMKDTSATEIARDALKIPPKSLGFDLLLGAYLELISILPFEADWLSVLGTAFKSKNDEIRAKAVACLLRQSQNCPEKCSDFFSMCLSGAEKERDAAAQRGCLAALSAIPAALWERFEGPLLSVLMRAAKQTRPINDIERRCEAIRALERLLLRFKVSDVSSLKSLFEDGSLLADFSVDMRGDVGALIREAGMACFKAAGLELTPAIKNHLLEQAYGRIERLRIISRQLIPDFESFKEEGAVQGLIYTAGGLDAELAAEAVCMIRAAVSGSERVVTECLFSALRENNGRLQMPAIVTISSLIDLLSGDFLVQVFEYLRGEFLPKCTNIRKLLVAFRLLKVMRNVDGVQEYLQLQSQEHPYPAVRQLIQDQ